MAVMIARLNFLLAVSALTLLLFVLAGRFVLLKPIQAWVPALIPYLLAAYILAALMLTVLIVAKIVIRLGAISTAVRARLSGHTGIAAQFALYIAHLWVILVLAALFTGHYTLHNTWLALVGAVGLYAGAIFLYITNLRHRALPSSD